MPKLPEKKVGIIACSGEEIAEGTVTRQAALRVLQELRPEDTVTICLPLFLAGGEGDRAFARFHPTIAVDGCPLRCAARATETYSGKPAKSLVVSEFLAVKGFEPPAGRWRLNSAGQRAVEAMAAEIVLNVDELLGRKWSRRRGEFVDQHVDPVPKPTAQATCSCGTGLPVMNLLIDGEAVSLAALPAIFEIFLEAGREPSVETTADLMVEIKIYNAVPTGAEKRYAAAVAAAYAAYAQSQGVTV